jgi:hypothetical protein
MGRIGPDCWATLAGSSAVSAGPLCAALALTGSFERGSICGSTSSSSCAVPPADRAIVIVSIDESTFQELTSRGHSRALCTASSSTDQRDGPIAIGVDVIFDRPLDLRAPRTTRPTRRGDRARRQRRARGRAARWTISR